MMTYMAIQCPRSPKLVARLHRWLNNYYDCDLERLRRDPHLRRRPDFRPCCQSFIRMFPISCFGQ